MEEAGTNRERVIDVREIAPHLRHRLIFQLFDRLGSNCLQLVADHDPLPLRRQLEAVHGDDCGWSYLEEGPAVWRIRLQNLRGEHK